MTTLARSLKTRFLSTLAGLLLVTAPFEAHALTKDDIINMSNIGVADAVIISAIQASDSVFSLSPADIIELTKAGVSQSIIEAMQKTAPSRAPAPEPSTSPSGVERTTPTQPSGTTTTTPPPQRLPPNQKPPVEEIRRPQNPPPSQGSGKPTAVKVKALPADVKTLKERYRQGKYNTAADLAFDLLTGPNKDRYSDHRSTIYFYLGSSLYQLKLYHSAHDIFLTVAREGATDENYTRALAMLDKTSKRLKEFDQFKDLLEGASTTDLPRTARSTLLYLIGLGAYERQDFEDARRALEGVEDSTTTYAQALFLDGMSLYRQGNYQEAVRRFKRLVTARELVGSTDDIQESKDLALLNMARIYYRVENFEAARRLYAQIPRSSNHWPRALYENSYASFWLGDYNVALGDIMTIESPFYRETVFLPESQIIKALVYFNLCEYDKVGEIVSDFQNYYKPIRDAIRKFLTQYKSGSKFGDEGVDAELSGKQAADAFALLFESKARRKALGIPEEILTALQRQKDFTNHVHHLGVIKQEIYDLTDGAVKRKGTALGKTLLQKLNDDQLLVRRSAGKSMLRQLERVEKELSGLLGEADIISFEVVSAQKDEYEDKFRNPEKIETYEQIELSYATESTFIFWPFNGEYWQDELGYYRFTERGACKSSAKK